MGLNSSKKGDFMLQVVIFGLFALVLGAADAQNLPANVIYRQGTSEVTLEEALAQVHPGEIVVLGEQHGTEVMAGQQLQVLENLRKNGLHVSVGMEFFPYPNQADVDAWRRGELTEEALLQNVDWGKGFPFSAYRQQVLFPNLNTEFVVALNAPRTLTGKIAQQGLLALNEEEKALMPPQFSLGNSAYKTRFNELMTGSGHVPTAEQMDNYFAAQSTWDDTMAWRAQEFLNTHPDQVLVIIVGEFHVQYGGGLPDRLKARGQHVTSFSLVNLDGLSDVEQRAEVLPSAKDGNRADFVWTSRFSL